MDLDKAATCISSLKTFNPNHKWSLQDEMLHERGKKIHDREASIAFRKDLLESQLRVNYVIEFDRLKGLYYANKNLPAPTVAHLEELEKQLNDLAKESIHGKDHLYKDNVDDYKNDFQEKK